MADGRRPRPVKGSLCPQCRKRVMTEIRARRLAMHERTSVRRMSAVRQGYDRVNAYPCPHGNGWHIGRSKARKWEAPC